MNPTSLPRHHEEGFHLKFDQSDGSSLAARRGGPTDVRRHPRVVKASIRGNACVIPHRNLQFQHKYNTDTAQIQRCKYDKNARTKHKEPVFVQN